jgi:hypothetical protein
VSTRTTTGRTFPDRLDLERWLADALGTSGPVQVLERRAEQSGSFPKEVVTCRREHGQVEELFCKYSAPRPEDFGHRRGVPYEALVYERLLSRVPMPFPGFRGAHRDAGSGAFALFLDYLPEARRARVRAQELEVVTQWLGEFHRRTEGAGSDRSVRFLIRYDPGYYAGWARRTSEYSARFHGDLPWLPAVCEAFPALVAPMIEGPLTVVHGEFTVSNALLVGQVVAPCDWESAAVAFGEIDLACLLDGWAPDIVERCTRSYAAARWPDGPPGDYPERLRVAELYLHLRWLGKSAQAWASDAWVEEKALRRLSRLSLLSNSLGVD